MPLKKKASKSKVKKAVGAVKGLLGKSGKGGRSKKRSASWYLRDTLRLKARRRWNQEKLRSYR